MTRSAEALDLARVSNHGEIVIERRPPRVAFGDALAKPPPGGFLQATEMGEAWLAEFAAAALTGAKKVADLFCGAGAFALRLGRRHEVFAVDARRRRDRRADARRRATRRACATLRPRRAISSAVRCEPHELAAFDAALIDPPRAGALEQARALAASTLPLVVSISCNAATFARDARVLIDGGFEARIGDPA